MRAVVPSCKLIQYEYAHREKTVCIDVDEEEKERKRERGKLSAGSILHVMPWASNISSHLPVPALEVYSRNAGSQSHRGSQSMRLLP